jgi:hypothetical protein
MSDIVVVSGSGADFDVVVNQFEAADPNLGGVNAGAPIQVVVQPAGQAGVGSVSNLKDLLDVNSSNLGSGTNKFVLTYDAGDDKFKFINPDEVISSAVGVTTTDPAPVGLTTQTIDYLDDVLDNKIDLDAGEW